MVAELPLTVQLVSVAVRRCSCTGRRRRAGGVAADGAVGQRGRAAARCCTGRRRTLAELPLTVQLVSVVVPPVATRPPPSQPAELPLTVQLVSVAVPSS